MRIFTINYINLTQEIILAQLQHEEAKANYPSESQYQYPLYATVRKDRKGKGKVAAPVRNTSTSLVEEEVGAAPYQLRPRSLMLSYK